MSHGLLIIAANACAAAMRAVNAGFADYMAVAAARLETNDVWG